MAKKKSQYQKKPFESTGASADTSANIYNSMLLSAAWQALSPKQQQLYLVCKAQYYADKTFPQTGQFTMNRSKWSGLYQLYPSSANERFARDMAELINHGFVICEQNGKTTRTKTIYRYSDQWKLWGTPEFNVSQNEKTLWMLNREKK